MKRIVVAALAVGLAMPLTSTTIASAAPSRPDSSPDGTINISCYRGALRSTVAWDRPNAVFVEDLVAYGYSWEQAHSIGMRLCRDEWGIGNAQHKIDSLKKIMRDTPVR